MTSQHELARAIEAVAAVLHADPHTILGPHAEGGHVVVRAFRPDAVAITVLTDAPRAAAIAMKRVDPRGLFEARIAGAKLPFRYRIEVRYATGTFTLRCPYAFESSLGELDLHLVQEGTHEEIYRRLGAHVRTIAGVRGTAFAVWAPQARRVSVTGDFNGWDGRLHAMRRMGRGIWEIFIPDIGAGALYKFEIVTPQGPSILKSDPYGRAMELRPNTASKVVERTFEFTDAAWMAARSEGAAHRRPMAIYEVHLGSWRRVPMAPGERSPDEGGTETTRWMTYRELADELVDHVADLGFTHVELLPVMEHPYDGSWGYQVSGYFAPTARFGSPDDLRYFIDRMHARGIGVLLDWVPAHFPKDAAALGRFDGTALYEHLDPRQGEHRQWQTYVFNYGRAEVRNFLVGNALYWIDEFHVDGLRVDAVASMLYLDYGASNAGEWVPNMYGGRENLEAIAFLRELNDRVHAKFPGALVVAEESTSWPGVTRATEHGGLGFDLKWNMGWMHDTLDYFELDPLHRAFHHGKLTFGLMYAFSERFLLPLSHDEVVHLKKSLLSKMPGDRWKMHANLRSLYALMWAHPGKKLLFMGGEIGQYSEWHFGGQLDWHLLEEADHRGLSALMRHLNAMYKASPALWELDFDPEGFTWIDPDDTLQSLLSFVRFPKQPPAPLKLVPEVAPTEEEPGLPPPWRGDKQGTHVVFVGNFTPVPRHGYRLGVPRRCLYREVVNTDAKEYGGGGMGNLGLVASEDVPCHGFAQSIVLTVPPLGSLWLVPDRDRDEIDDVGEARAAG